jgi:LysR family hydrogen peroxide-inducible transcriptional activator
MLNLPTLKQLEYFVQLGRTLKFTDAAQNCFVNQSTLSVGISELEQLLGIKLFERTSKNVMLTDIGQALLPKAQHILQSSRDLIDFVNAQKQPMHGRLVLGIIPTIAPFILAKLIQITRTQYPHIDLVVRELTSQRLVEQLNEGVLDFGLLALPFNIKGLAYDELFEDELYLTYSKKRQFPAQVPMSDIKTDDLILLQDSHCLRDHVLTACDLNPKHSAHIETSSLPTLIELICADVGFSLLPHIAMGSSLIKDNELSFQSLHLDPPAHRTLALVYRSTQTKEPERLFLRSCLIDEFKQIQAQSAHKERDHVR